MKYYFNSNTSMTDWVSQNSEIKSIKKTDRFDSISVEKLKIKENSYLGQIVGWYTKIHTCNDYFTILCGFGKDSIIEMNAVNDYGVPELFQQALVIAYDQCGNIFAINAGAEKDARYGDVIYLPVDCLTWENLEINYPEFLYWVFTATTEDLESGCWKSNRLISTKTRMKYYILGKAATYSMIER